MSKGYSGLFQKTAGAKIHNRHPLKMKAEVCLWAQSTANRLSAKSNNQRNKFNTACVVYDTSTGKYYNGRNHGISIDHEKKNPVIFGDSTHKGLLPKESLNGYALGNCAEVHAINKALNDGARLSNLVMYTIHTTKSSFGKSKPACKNCTHAFKGKINTNYTGWHEGE